MAHGASVVMAAALAALAVGLIVPRHRARWAGAVAAVIIQPLLAVVGGVGWGVATAHHRLRRRRREAEAAADDVGALAELVGLGLSAGLNLRQALEAAAGFVHPRLRAEVSRLLQRAVGAGLAASLADATGYGRRLYVVSARAVVTGAPLGAAVDAFAQEMATERYTRQLAEAHRLPVRLMLPLALFILPGFVLLTVGPAVLAALDRVVLPG